LTFVLIFNWYYQIDRPFQDKKLPSVLSIEEVKSIIESIDNLKHKCIIQLIYSAGLRISELTNLKIKDIDKNRKQIFVRGGKDLILRGAKPIGFEVI
jgi:integrase/recombinase XerD